MYKVKTHSGAKKRIKRTKSGLFKAAHVGRRKMLTKKSAKRKQGLRKKVYLGKADSQKMAYRLPVK